VQPVSIAYTRLDGMPIGHVLRPFFAWYGDMDLAPHMWNLVGLGRVTVLVEFHPVVTLAELGSRKALAEHCQRAVAAGVAAALSGHRPEQTAGQAPPVGKAIIPVGRGPATA
jgi:1-acyl-sn-glycerol-3-phosphate acyltransferase